MTDSFSAPKRGDLSIEDDEDDSLTSGDGDQSGDGQEPEDPGRFPEVVEKEENNMIGLGSSDAIVPQVNPVQPSFSSNTTAVPPTSSIITSSTTTTTTTTEAPTTTTTTPRTIPTERVANHSTETLKTAFNRVDLPVDGDQITSELTFFFFLS